MIKNVITENQIFTTHAGIFHADDVFSVAYIKMFNPEAKIIRTLDPKKFEGLCVDIGRGKYDHHQLEADWRPDGSTKYCGFGLLWRDTAEDFLGKEVAEIVDEELVLPIDKADNGVEMNLISSLISKMNPTWLETGLNKYEDDKLREECFCNAIKEATRILEIYIKNAKATAVGKKEYEDSERRFDGKVVLLDNYLPFNNYAKPEELFVIYPHNRGGFALQAINEKYSMQTKHPLPESWRGLNEEKCNEVVPGMIFCHASGFLAVFKNICDALNALETFEF